MRKYDTKSAMHIYKQQGYISRVLDALVEKVCHAHASSWSYDSGHHLLGCSTSSRSTPGLTSSDGELPSKWVTCADTEFLAHGGDGGWRK